MFLLDRKTCFEFIDIHKILLSLFHRRWNVIGLEQQYKAKYEVFSLFMNEKSYELKKPWFLRLCGWSSEVRVTVWQEVTLWSLKHAHDPWARPLIQHCVSEGTGIGHSHITVTACALSPEKKHTQSISRGLYLPGCPLWIFYLNTLGMSLVGKMHF